MEKKRIYSIVGISKNSGKTTLLNSLLREIRNEGGIGAVTSIGWDGEETDRYYQTEKPRVRLYGGFYAATCKSLIDRRKGSFTILEDTRIETVLGSIYLVKSLTESDLEIVGPRNMQAVRDVLDRLSPLADYFFIDGALDRITSASPLFSDGFLLALSSSYSSVPQELEEKLSHLAEKYFASTRAPVGITSPPPDYNSVCVKEPDGKWCVLPVNSLMGKEELIKDIRSPFAAIYTPGAVTDLVIERLLSFFSNCTVFVQDFTKDFTSGRTGKLLARRNSEVRYLNASPLKGIVVSSFHPRKKTTYPPRVLLSLAEKYFPGIPVTDLFISCN